MASNRGPRSAVLLIGLSLIGLASGPPVIASTGNLGYGCSLPVLGKTTFQIDQDVDISRAYIGSSVVPVVTTKARVPADKVELMASALKAKYVEGSITASIKTDGVAAQVTQAVPRTPIPPSGPLMLVGTGSLDRLAPEGPGSTTYSPGNMSITLRFFQSEADAKPTEFSDMPCTMPATTRVIDTVAFIKSASKVSLKAAYAKRPKKVTAVAKVTTVSGVVPTGQITAVLYKGKKKLKTLTANLSRGTAKVVVKGVKVKGAYKILMTYSGSAAAEPSRTAKTVRVR